ncbi:MAG: alpha/beta hydrolase [Chitinophaga sp.]|uniref:alpha/beta hydrolase n=1 Tax=Chitinophaga sp. TaxID=1869181 RepID=UPI0025B96CCD|nr:alpha/beta hydrolase [Chitinophaga sp.]MBV8252591.1 alpha/beta hydrolase [Chitinophaga sp.]
MHNHLILPTEVTTALEFIQSIQIPDVENEILAGRKFYEAFIPMAGEADQIFAVEDVTVPSPDGDINIRVYRPSDEPLLPAVLYFHGGWFNAGSLETHDRPLRTLTRLSQCIVIAVDYRLAPEYPFPHGLNDCCHILKWMTEQSNMLGIDTHRISVMGDSAGGAVATVVARRAVREMNISIRCQVLIYPVTDSSLSTVSWKQFAEGPNLTLEGALIAWNQYTPDATSRNHPDAAPLLADDIAGLPPALIIIAEYDPLRDEAIQYARKLKEAGVEVKLSEYKGMVHGFFQMGGIIPQGIDAINEAALYIKKNISLL